MNEIKIGDIVTLKSDPSLKMTIGDYVNQPDHFVVCFYFVNGEIRQFNIHKEALQKHTISEANPE